MSEAPRSVCVLFAEISGSSRLYERLGDAEAHHAVERRLHRIERAAMAFKGRVVKALGDELMIAFESTEAAMHAASEMRLRIDALPPVSGMALAVRVGFHYGPVVEQDGGLSGDTVDVASRLAKLAKAGQALTTAEAVLTLPMVLRGQTRAIDALTMPGKDGPMHVCEVVSSHADETSHMKSPSGPGLGAPAEMRLRLRLGDQELILGPHQPTATLGRDANADIVTMDTRASRSHGRIEYRRDKYVLIDQSTNGTYVTFAGEPELVLKREEAVLSGRGHVCFGHTAGDGPTETLEFEILG
jgi:adenylate cyclase